MELLRRNLLRDAFAFAAGAGMAARPSMLWADDLSGTSDLVALEKEKLRAGSLRLLSTTPEYDRLATDPSLHLPELRKNIGVLIITTAKTPEEYLKKMMEGDLTGIEMGSITYYGNGLVGLDAHEVVPGSTYIAGFSPFPGVLTGGRVEVIPNTVNRDIDYAVGRLANYPKVEAAGVSAVNWGSWGSPVSSDKPLVLVSALLGKLHASVGRYTGYLPSSEASSAFDRTKMVIHSCKIMTSNVAEASESGGMITREGKFLGLVAGYAKGEKSHVVIGSTITPVESIKMQLTEYLPAEAARLGVSFSNADRNFARSVNKECVPGG